MQYSDNYRFPKPDPGDQYNIEDYNTMVDGLDAAMHEASENASVAASSSFRVDDDGNIYYRNSAQGERSLGNIKGQQGAQGQAGPQGPQGQQGPKGDTGATGPQGEPGPVGPKGEDGSVSFDDLTPEQKAELKGDKGDKGETGPQGPQGEQGPQGPKGDTASLNIMTYGVSTWAEFLAAYKTNSIVYCRASSGSDPAVGDKTRMAFMAYVNKEVNPTEVEFQYYRSMSSHADATQGDQVFVYKLTSQGVWSVIVRNAYTRIDVGTGLKKSYSNGVLTISLS